MLYSTSRITAIGSVSILYFGWEVSKSLLLRSDPDSSSPPTGGEDLGEGEILGRSGFSCEVYHV